MKQALAKRWLGTDEASAYTTRPAPEEKKPIRYPVINGLSVVCYCGTQNDFPPNRNALLVCSCCRAALFVGNELVPGCRAP